MGVCMREWGHLRMKECLLLRNVFCYNRRCSLTSYMNGGICVLCVAVFVRILYVLRANGNKWFGNKWMTDTRRHVSP